MILAKRENGFNGFLNYMTSKYGAANEEEDSAEVGKKKRGKKGEQNQGEAQPSPNKRKKTK
jgi:hypothetical protein